MFGGFTDFSYLCKCNRDYNCDCGMRLSILEQVQSAFALYHSCNQERQESPDLDFVKLNNLIS